jgi:hypothetical protein
MARIFNEEDNDKIHYACNSIRSLMTVSSAMAALKNPGSGITEIVAKTDHDSLINKLIVERNWEKLFKNEEWLNVLEGAMNLNTLQGGTYKKYLITIAEFFPNETELHIISEFL